MSERGWFEVTKSMAFAEAATGNLNTPSGAPETTRGRRSATPVKWCQTAPRPGLDPLGHPGPQPARDSDVSEIQRSSPPPAPQEVQEPLECLPAPVREVLHLEGLSSLTPRVPAQSGGPGTSRVCLQLME